MMAIVATYDLGYCRVFVHDDAYINRTRAEMDASWHEFSNIVVNAVAKQLEEEDRQKAKEKKKKEKLKNEDREILP